MVSVTDDVMTIETPEQLADKAVFSELIRRRFGSAVDIHSIKMAPLSQAILSQVVEITLSYCSEATVDVPISYIAKFQKESLPLQDMFRVEGCFYDNFADEFRTVNDLGLYVPQPLFSGEKCVVMEKIVDTTSYTLLESCPPERLELVFRGMARMHTHFWNFDYGHANLSATAGIGAAMTGLEKEHAFCHCWKDFVCELNLSQQERLRPICESLAQRRLRDIHDCAYGFKPTLVHGDFHVGNLLFKEDKIWLVDWATCGDGNPMADVVFFFLISTRLTMTALVETWLPFYYHELTTCTSKAADFSWETCLFMFRTCVLNQFLVLVCYDKIGKTLLEQEASGEYCAFYKQHFENVNRRCVDALLSNEMDLSSYPLPPVKTEHELRQSAQPTKTDNVIREL